VRVAAESHLSTSAVITSCQRFEAYSFEGCDCRPPERRTGLDALLHLAEVAAGLDSVVLGEEQIIAQVRAALAEAPAEVRELGDIALASARELRRETAFNTHSGHLLDRALKVSETPHWGRLLVVGTGHMGRLVAQRGLEIGFEEVVVAGRRRPEGAWFTAGNIGFQPLETLRAAEAFDVAVGCLGSDAGELEIAAALPPIRRLIVDLGTPRNFAGPCEVPLVSIATLLSDTFGRRHRNERRDALRERLQQILERRLAMASEDSTSVVGALRFSVEMVRQREMERLRRLHPDIAPETLEVITRSLVNQLFHAPSERLKRMNDPELGQHVLSLFAPATASSDGANL
jgi:glutamyl-tRNA reductase